MFGKKVLVAAALVMASSLTLAETVPHTVMVEANVPTAAFYVNPLGGNWINSPVVLGWNTTTEELTPAVKQFEMKSTLGPIQAHLVNPAKLVSGAHNIDLQISVGGKVLSTTAVEVLEQALALTGQRSELKIAAVKPASGFEAGNYMGNVELMFESVVTP